jgi:hypothetical protein
MAKTACPDKRMTILYKHVLTLDLKMKEKMQLGWYLRGRRSSAWTLVMHILQTTDMQRGFGRIT